jgi:hypothetical protein
VDLVCGTLETSVLGLAVVTGSYGEEQNPTKCMPDLTSTAFRVIAPHSARRQGLSVPTGKCYSSARQKL